MPPLDSKYTVMRNGDLQANNDECSNRIFGIVLDDNPYEIKVSRQAIDDQGVCSLSSD